MAEASEGQEKTEEPTQKRLEKAKEDGQVASSKELFVFSTLFVGLLLYLGITPFLPSLLQEWSGLFSFRGDAGLADEVFGNLAAGFGFMFLKSIIFAIPLLVVVVLTQMAMSGAINWSASALGFKGKRINPINGFKRMFSVKALVEMLKAIGKVVLLLGAALLVFVSQVDKLFMSQHTHLFGGLSRMAEVFLLLIAVFLLVLGLLAIFDVMWQHYQHNQQLRMTLQEVKDENKQTEGSPEVKGKIRRMQLTAVSRAKQRKAALDSVPTATAIITNPTHFAVALKYEVGAPGAPVILAMGRGHLAQQIIDIGKEAGVTVFRNELLARALFFAGTAGEEIPPPLYTAVAAVLAFIYRINKNENVEEPTVDLPEEMRFDANGKVMS
jgi:flagellar biosynthetic protein FlhB